MNALIVQKPCHKCDWETRMIADKKIIADSNNNYYTEIILYTCMYVCYNLHSTSYLEYTIPSI